MNSNLDVYAIQENKYETLLALSKVKKDSLGNILYLNCTCYFSIGDTEITSRIFDSCFYSEESDVLILFAKGKITINEIEDFLKRMNVNYTTIAFNRKETDFVDRNTLKEIWFARDKEVLEEAITDSIVKDNGHCFYYPEEVSRLSIGYNSSDDASKYFQIDGRVCKGTIVFKDKIVLVVNQNDKRNLNKDAVMAMLKKRVKVTVVKEGMNSIRGR